MSRWTADPPGASGKRASVLAVAGGLVGMTTALHLAEWGAEVTLVERASHMGGAFLHLDHTFTTDSRGFCLALPSQPSLCPTMATADHPRITPMTHTTLTGLRGEVGCFTATLRRAPLERLTERLELPPRLPGRANLREGAAWPFGEDRAVATVVGQSEIAMAVAALRETPDRPLAAEAWAGAVQPAPARRMLVLGGGLAGMTAALILAELGVDCHLVEREAELGENLQEAIYTLEGLDAQKLLRETVDRVHQSDGVEVWTEAELVAWSRTQGDFRAEIRVRGELRTEVYGALVVATGAEAASTDAGSAAREYLCGRHPRVVTKRELERWIATGGEPNDERPGLAVSCTADGVHPRSVVMIQCIGSRDEGHPYCLSLPLQGMHLPHQYLPSPVGSLLGGGRPKGSCPSAVGYAALSSDPHAPHGPRLRGLRHVQRRVPSGDPRSRCVPSGRSAGAGSVRLYAGS